MNRFINTKGVLIKKGEYFQYFYIELKEEDALYNNLDKIIGIDGELEDHHLDWLEQHLYEEVECMVMVYTCDDGEETQIALPKELIGERKNMVHRVNDVIILTESLYDYEDVGTLHGFKTKLTHVSIYKEDRGYEDDEPVYEEDGFHKDEPHEYICTIISDEDFGDGSVFEISNQTIQEQISKGNVYTIIDKDYDKIVDGRLITGFKLRNGAFSYEDLEMTTLVMFDLTSHEVRLGVKRVKTLTSNEAVMFGKLTEVYNKNVFIEYYEQFNIVTLQDDETMT